MNESALNVQVDGRHYKDLAIQPVEYIHANGLGFCEGSVVKYVTRWRAKNGIADLKKARHFIDLLIELEEKAPPERKAASVLRSCDTCKHDWRTDEDGNCSGCYGSSTKPGWRPKGPQGGLHVAMKFPPLEQGGLGPTPGHKAG